MSLEASVGAVPNYTPPIPEGVIDTKLPDLLTGGFEPAENLRIFSSTGPFTGDLVQEAGQELRTQVYLEHGFITEDELDSDGVYRDKYEDRSVYFYSRNGTKDGTIRMIDCDAKKRGGIASLPTFEDFSIEPELLKEALGVERLTDIDPKKTVEISALASMFKKDPGEKGELDAIPALYSIMLRHSLEQGHTAWVFSTHPAVQKILKGLIGEEQLHQVGDPMYHMGTKDTPYVVKPQEVVRKLLGSSDPKYDFHKLYLRRIFDGMDARNVPKDIRDILDANEIEYQTPSRMERILSSRKNLGRLGVNGALIAYTTARAVPLSQLHQFHGGDIGVGIFWGLDTAPVPLYVWGMEKTFSNKSTTRERALGAVAAAGTFAAPYAYAYAEGSHYPGYVNAAVAGFIGLAVGTEAVKRVSRKRQEQDLTARLVNAYTENDLELVA